MQLAIINHRGAFSICWDYIDLIVCILSSYLYAYMGAYGIHNDLHVNDSDIKHISLFLTLDVYFGVCIIKRFITDFMPLGSCQPERNPLKIAKNYLTSDFALDFLMWLPITSFKRVENEWRYLLFIKCYRLVRTFNYLKVTIMMSRLKHNLMRRSQERCMEDPIDYGENQTQDLNHIEDLMYLHYGLNTFKLMIKIFAMCFMIACFWKVYCDIFEVDK